MLEEVESESSDDSSIDPDYTYEDVIAFRASALKNGIIRRTPTEQGMIFLLKDFLYNNCFL